MNPSFLQGILRHYNYLIILNGNIRKVYLVDGDDINKIKIEIADISPDLALIINKNNPTFLSVVNRTKISPEDIEFLQKSILTNSEIEQFVKENEKLIKALCDILDGTLLYAIKNLNAYKEELGDFITNNIVEEKQEIGKTFVNLFQNETFNSHYYASIPKFDEIKYFDFYFDRPIYSGKTLMTYITGGCIIFPLLKMILDNSFTPQQLQNIYKETNVTSL